MVTGQRFAIERQIPTPRKILRTAKIIWKSNSKVHLETQPLVSVIIATYNWSGVLRIAIESVLRQDYGNFELIIVGDRCTDDTAEVVQSFQDPRIHFYNLETNSGSQSIPNNFGISKAQGKYIAYLGHDDIWLSNRLSKSVEFMERTSAQLAFSGLIAHGPVGSNMLRISNVYLDPSCWEWFAPSCAMHTRAALDVTGLWRDFRTLDIGPIDDLFNRFREVNFAPRFVDSILALKFPAAWSPNSYITKSDEIQRRYLKASSSKYFVARELWRYWVRKLLARPERHPINELSASQDKSKKGWELHMFREIRGLPKLHDD